MSQPAKPDATWEYIQAVRSRFKKPSFWVLADQRRVLESDRDQFSGTSGRPSDATAKEVTDFSGPPEHVGGSDRSSDRGTESNDYGQRRYEEGLARGREEAERERTRRANEDLEALRQARRVRSKGVGIEELVEDCVSTGKLDLLDRLLKRLEAIEGLMPAPYDANESVHDQDLRDTCAESLRRIAWVVSRDLYDLIAELRMGGTPVSANRSNELGNRLARELNRKFCEGRSCFIALVDNVRYEGELHSCKSGDENGDLRPLTFLLTDGSGRVEKRAILVRQESGRA